MQKSAGKGLRELVGVYEDSADLQEKDREYLRALGILAESPTPSKEEMDQMIEYFNQFISHYEEEYSKKYPRSEGDINPKEAYFHSLLGDL